MIPEYTPPRRMLREAILGAAQSDGSKAPQWIAEDLLDAYGLDHAAAIADHLAGLVRKEHARRCKVQALRPRPDMAQLSATVQPVAAEPDVWGADLPAAIRAALIGAVVLALAGGFAVAAWSAVSGVQSQIERGAVEW